MEKRTDVKGHNREMTPVGTTTLTIITNILVQLKVSQVECLLSFLINTIVNKKINLIHW